MAEKFIIKFWFFIDVELKYIVNSIPYLGKDKFFFYFQRLYDRVVLQVMEQFFGKRRNMTMDIFFTFLVLAKQLKNEKTGLVSTVNKPKEI